MQNEEIEHRVDIVALRDEVRELTKTVAELSETISEMARAWQASKGVLFAVKWLAALSASLAVAWAALTGGHPK